MPSQFITRASIECNGQIIPISKVKEDNRKEFVQVKQMFSTTFAQITVRFSGEFVYEVPKTGAVVFENFNGGTLTMDLDGGDRIEYGGVYFMELGDLEFDMEMVGKRIIKWGAQTRNGNDGSTLLPA